MANERYFVQVEYKGGWATLTCGNGTWDTKAVTMRTARKHEREYRKNHGENLKTRIVPENP